MKQLDKAAEICRESRRDGKHPGQYETPAAIAREVGRELYGDDEADWKCSRRTIEDRLRKYPEKWQRGEPPADAD
ncbi:MAG: hypothetical protein JRG67_15025 [Deltaproteobacteria bacterium]|nr:hypothetical protein [Deltaproteobacteria bacterium]